MKTKFLPVILYYHNDSQGIESYTSYVQKFIDALRDNLELEETKMGIPDSFNKNDIILLFTNDKEEAANSIKESNLSPKRIVVMGYMTEGDFLGFLEEAGIAGLITLSALEKWLRLKLRPDRMPNIRMVVDYGLFGRKEAFNSSLFKEENFDIYARDKYGYFEPVNRDDRLNLELNLSNFATEWLSFLNKSDVDSTE